MIFSFLSLLPDSTQEVGPHSSTADTSHTWMTYKNALRLHPHGLRSWSQRPGFAVEVCWVVV